MRENLISAIRDMAQDHTMEDIIDLIVNTTHLSEYESELLVESILSDEDEVEDDDKEVPHVSHEELNDWYNREIRPQFEEPITESDVEAVVESNTNETFTFRVDTVTFKLTLEQIRPFVTNTVIAALLKKKNPPLLM